MAKRAVHTYLKGVYNYPKEGMTFWGIVNFQDSLRHVTESW